MKYVFWITGGVIILLIGIFIAGIFRSGIRDASALETITGIPYPNSDSGVVVSEALAHADIYLHESVFAKELTLRLVFDPGNAKKISVGIRENSFWLSYAPKVIWDDTNDAGVQNVTVSFPVTASLQDTDRSLDVMFFADGDATANIERGSEHDVVWTLESMQASVQPVLPTLADSKDFVRSVIMKERAL